MTLDSLLPLWLLEFLDTGLLDLSWLSIVLVTLGLTHLTIISVTVYLHRHQAHRALELHPLVSHAMRFWLWLTTGMVTREWVATHRKHHAAVETKADPHSPQQVGIRKVLFQGAELYRDTTADEAIMDKYSHGTPTDWIERNLYSPHAVLGVSLMMIIDVALFGAIGLTVWAVQMAWIPFWAAGVINGVGHWAGYRNFESADASTNIVPFGLIIGGEELHNNHHAFGSSARFSYRRWEFDAGWMYIRGMEMLGLAKVLKVAPRIDHSADKAEPDSDTLTAVLAARLPVMAQYASSVLAKVHAEEMRLAKGAKRQLLKPVRQLAMREDSRLSLEGRERLKSGLAESSALETVYEYKQRLQAIWEERTATQEALVARLREWCREAEASGIASLQEFARSLPRTALAVAPVAAV